MARGSAKKRKIKAWNAKANHGQKPAKGRPQRWPRYDEILKQRHERRFNNGPRIGSKP